jgi:hypothetical protein
MKLGSKRLILAGAGMMVVWLIGVMFTGRATAQASQPGTAAKPQTAGEVFKNVTTSTLKGITVDDFMGSMGVMSAALGFDCSDCHTGAGTDKVDWVYDTPRKKTARRMVEMVAVINRTNFGGAQMVTCYTCHHGRDRPPTTIALDTLYGPPNEERDDIIGEASGPPSADQILDKYIQALGGAERLAAITSLSAKGTYSGFDTDLGKVPVEVFAKSSGQSTTIVHRSEKAQNITTFDGHNGWIAMTNTILPVKSLTGGELDGAQLDAEMFFPAGIKKYLHDFRVGFPPTSIDDHLVQVVQATAPGGTRVKLFFDAKSGLLVRVARFADTTLGFNPSQMDYSDYRDLAGVKVPFHWTLTWTDGRSEFEMTDVQPNVPIDAAKFGEPMLPKPATP